MNYARRQQCRRLSRAGTAAAGSAAAAVLALALARTGTNSLAGALLVAAVGLGLYSRIGAHSEDEVQRARHLARVREQAAWLSRRRRGRCRRGAVPVVCLVRAHGVQRFEHGVLVVSIDRLPLALRDAATVPDPLGG